MAKRPIFAPMRSGTSYILEKYVDFTWHPGMSLKQKQKSITELHKEARLKLGLERPLEISSKSDQPLGVALSSFNLNFQTKNGRVLTVESAFQGSKVFKSGGPFVDIFEMSPKDAKRDTRLRQNGEIVEFRFFGLSWPTRPMTLFYDWLYINALLKSEALIDDVTDFEYFTDIEFNPDRSINCQARSLALFIALFQRGIVKEALASPESFRLMHTEHMPKPLQSGSGELSF